jgi:asparagine synthase (glutamine-hydrolysing)
VSDRRPGPPGGWVAGSYSVLGETEVVRAVHRVAEVRGGRVVSAGPLVVGFGGGASVAEGSALCVVAGSVQETGALARRLDIDATLPPAAIIAKAYSGVGIEALADLRGSFSLVLWDAERGRGALSQDLIGLWSMFYVRRPGGAAFGSEVRDLLCLLPTRPAPDRLALTHVLGGQEIPPGHTLFDGVLRPGPGTCVRLENGRAQVARHWRPRYRSAARLSGDDFYGALKESVDRAVERALDGSCRAGVILSGGLDSSIVASSAAAGRRDLDLTAYSAVFPMYPDVDESRYVDSVTRRHGLRSRRVSPLPCGSFATALEYLDAWEVPVLGIGTVLERPLIAQAAADGVDVVLDGQGGDEVFMASPYLPAHQLRRGRPFKSMRQLLETPWGTHIRSRQALMAAWRGSVLLPALPRPLLPLAERVRRAPAQMPAWLTPSASAVLAGSMDAWRWRRSGGGPLWWRHMAHVLTELPTAVGRTDYLRHRAGLRGLRAGSPLLDPDLAEFVLRLPPELAYDRRRDRPHARDAMAGVLPEEVYGRVEKSNLLSFYAEVLAGKDWAIVRELLSDPSCGVYEFVDRRHFAAALERPPAGDGTDGMLVGVLHSAAVIECWLRQQADDRFAREALERVPDAGIAAPETPAAAVL